MEPINQSQRMSFSPKDFFLHLGIIVALYVSAVSVITLLFRVIEYAFPDALQNGLYQDPYSTGMRLAIASLIIFFPAYLFLGWLYNRELKIAPEKRELGVRRWLVYLTLFIAGLTIVIDLVTLLNSFLGGEISSRFILKVLAVLIVAGFIFFYYILDLRGKVRNGSIFKGFMIGSVLFVILSLATGFSVLGSPLTQRNLRFDNQRVTDLQNIQYQIVNYWQSKQVLPQTLSQISDSISGNYIPLDPQSQVSYEYRPTGATSFELCTTFALPAPQSNARVSVPMPYPVANSVEENWQHQAGHSCFTRTIDPDRYPPIKK